MKQSTTDKQRTNISLTAANLAAAGAEAWAVENAAAISERHTWIEANGMPLADLQVLKIS